MRQIVEFVTIIPGQQLIIRRELDDGIERFAGLINGQRRVTAATMHAAAQALLRHALYSPACRAARPD
jgi:hypothetical protein